MIAATTAIGMAEAIGATVIAMSARHDDHHDAGSDARDLPVVPPVRPRGLLGVAR